MGKMLTLKDKWVLDSNDGIMFYDGDKDEKNSKQIDDLIAKIIQKGGHGSGIRGHRTAKDSVAKLSPQSKKIVLAKLKAEQEKRSGGMSQSPKPGNAEGGTQARSYDSGDKAKAFLSSTYGGWKTSGSKQEKYAYAVWQSPTGYKLMNGLLRGNLDEQGLSVSGSDRKIAQKANVDLQKAIAKAPVLPHAIEVYRGFAASQFGKLSSGMEIKDKGFVATSLTKDGAGVFGGSDKKAITATIVLPKGTRAAAGDVKELTLPPGSRFKVLSVSPNGYSVKMELIL